jgi:hypothetical protein
MAFKDILAEQWSGGDGHDAELFLGEAMAFLNGDTAIVNIEADRGWVATQLGLPQSSLEWIKGPSNAKGGMYVAVERKGLRVYIHENRSTAYVDAHCPLSNEEIKERLKTSFGMVCTQEIQRKTKPWILVAQEHPARMGDHRYLSVSVSKLEQAQSFMEMGDDLIRLNQERLEAAPLTAVLYGDHFYFDGDRPPNWVDIFGKPLPASLDASSFHLGRGIKKVEDGLWKVTIPGFLTLDQGRLEVHQPIVVQSDGSQAHYLYHRDTGVISKIELDKHLKAAAVVHGSCSDLMERLQELHQQKPMGVRMVLCAQGTQAKDGQDARLEWLVPPLDSPGKVQEDGSIDYREGERVFVVEVGQTIAKKIHVEKGVMGINVRGEKTECKAGKDLHFEAGSGVEVVEEGTTTLYKCLEKGVPKLNRHSVEVVPSLFLPEGVNYNTGNIDFAGAVVVSGSIQSGFSLKADGDVTVFDSIENGATVTCRGKLRVGRGIIGAKTRVICKGNMETRFVQDATVMGGGDLLITDHLYHANIRCAGRVKVDRCSSSNRSGSIIGGYTWGVGGLKAHYVGSQGDIPTEVGVGPDDIMEREYRFHQNRLNDLHQQVTLIVDKLKLPKVTPEVLKKIKEKTPLYVPVIERLEELISQYQHQLGIVKKVKPLDEGVDATIDIQNRCFPKTQLGHGRFRRLLDKANFSKRWKVKDEALVGE